METMIISGKEVEYYPPVNSCAYDEHENDMYFIGDNYGEEDC